MKGVIRYLEKSGHQQRIEETPHSNLSMIVCIPCFDEKFEDITKCLKSLQVSASDQFVEVLLLINYPKDADLRIVEESDFLFKNLQAFAQSNSSENLQIFVLKEVFVHRKHAGVGLARKTLMDEALLRFDQIDRDGLIINLDADCVVSPNYFASIYTHFQEYENIECAGLHFEHELKDLPDDAHKNAIIQYELHLRYFINMQRWIKLPFAFQTIGSAMVVRSTAYADESGMNKRKAGEDFYFLHKYIKKEKYNVILNATVIPQGRSSERVPFGTGKAVGLQIASGEKLRLSYNNKSFGILLALLSKIDVIYDTESNNLNKILDSFHPILASYLSDSHFSDVVTKMKLHVSNKMAFRKRFFRWFDAFRLMKYLHYCRDNGLEDIPIDEAVKLLFNCFGLKEKVNLEEALMILRDFDKAHANEVQLSTQVLQ